MGTTFLPSVMKDRSGNLYKETIFWINVESEFAKWIIFAAEARIALRSKQLVWAAISGYYSLFHFSIMLMFMLPTYLEQRKLTDLIEASQGGAADPMWLIKHKEIPKFLVNCESKGLTSRLREFLIKAKDLREFVNYRPKIEYGVDGKLYFRTREFKPEDVRNIVESLESLQDECLLWAHQQGEWPNIYVLITPNVVKQFLTQTDLLYKEWCSAEVLATAEEIRKRIDNVKDS